MYVISCSDRWINRSTSEHFQYDVFQYVVHGCYLLSVWLYLMFSEIKTPGQTSHDLVKEEDNVKISFTIINRSGTGCCGQIYWQPEIILLVCSQYSPEAMTLREITLTETVSKIHALFKLICNVSNLELPHIHP